MKLKRYKILLLASILVLSLLTVSCKNSEKSKAPLSKTEFLMDTIMTVKIFDNQSEELMEEVFDRLRDIEAKMSFTIDTSDVNLVNKNAGIKPVKVDSETYFVLEKAIKYAELSDGYYEPTIGPLVDLWNIKSSDEERDSIPSEAEIMEKKSLIDYEKLQLADDFDVYLSEKNMKINLGSIAKGYAADQVKKILGENGVKSAIIDLGGNVYAYGDKGGNEWKIGVQDPNKVTGQKFGTINIKNKSIVSSGSYERYFIYKGKRYHHIINPKTGYPTDNGLLGVTIVSDKSIDGDALSTTIFVLGLEKGKQLISKLDGIEAVFITEDDEVYISNKYDEEKTFSDLSEGLKLKVY